MEIGYCDANVLPHSLPTRLKAGKLRLIVLGSGILASYGYRWPAGYVIQTDHHLILLDCNSRGLARFLQFGFELPKLQAIFVSHDHSEHSLGLVEWLEAIGTQCARESKTPALQTIAGPPMLKYHLACDINRHIPDCYNYLEVEFDIQVEDGTNQMFDLGHGLTVSGYQTFHDTNLPSSIGFVVDYEGIRIAYPSDFGNQQFRNQQARQSLLDHVTDVDLLILDAGAREPGTDTHLHISEAIEFGNKSQAKHVLVSHIPDDIEGNDQPVEIVRIYIIARGLQHHVSVACDGMYIDF